MNLTLTDINLDSIEPFDETKCHAHADLQAGIDDLSASIQENGLLQPILALQVSCEPPRYQVLDGWRRIFVFKMLGKATIRALVTEAILWGNDSQLNRESKSGYRSLILTPNLARRRADTKAIEEAVAFLHQEGLGYKKIAERLGYTKAGVQKVIRHLKEGSSTNSKRANHQLWRNAAKYLHQVRANLDEHEPLEILQAFKTVEIFIAEKINVSPETPPTPKEDPKNEPDDTNISPAKC